MAATKLYCLYCSWIGGGICPQDKSVQMCHTVNPSCPSGDPIVYTPKYKQFSSSSCSGDNDYNIKMDECLISSQVRGSVAGFCSNDGKKIVVANYVDEKCQGDVAVPLSLNNGTCVGSGQTLSQRGSGQYYCSGADATTIGIISAVAVILTIYSTL